MTPTSALAAAVAASILIAFAATGSAARARAHHHHHAVMMHAMARTVPPRTVPHHVPFSFYPNDIEGGVPGNLPFNNQIRKLTDPLNANGAGT